MAGTQVRELTAAADASEQEDLFALDRLLSEAQAARIVDPDGGSAPVPATALALIRQIVHQLAHDHVVTIVPSLRNLSTQQAADILNVSRPYLVQLLERGEIPFWKAGTHRRVKFDDLMAYKHRRDQEQRDALDELTRLSQEYGLYGQPARVAG